MEMLGALETTTIYSDWQVRGCAEHVTALRTWREPPSNADNFIARLTLTCHFYENVSPTVYAEEPGTRFLANVYSAARVRSGVLTAGLGSSINRVATGVHLKVNPNSHVKDVRLRYRPIYPGRLGPIVYLGDTATGLGGRSVNLDCPPDHALTGVEVRFSTNNGKIRDFRLRCKEFTY